MSFLVKYQLQIFEGKTRNVHREISYVAIFSIQLLRQLLRILNYL